MFDLGPGRLVEDLQQAAGVLSFATMGRQSDANSVFYFAGIDEARFKRPVVPGDQLRLEIMHKRTMRNMSLFHGQAFVGDELAAEAEMLCAEVPNG